MNSEDIALEFVAYQLHDKKSKEKGYGMSTRWWCTREDIKEECRQEARDLLNHWYAEEEKAKAG